MAVRYKSFEDRGVYVGFQTRMVQLCRVRKPKALDLDDYEALIPNWSGGDQKASNDLVMAMLDVPNWCSLEGRDYFLHQNVERRRSQAGGHLDPIMMREIRLETDSEHGDDIDKRAADHELSITRTDTQYAYLDILAMFGRNYADKIGLTQLSNVNRGVLMRLADESHDSLMRLVRILARTVSNEVGMSRELLQERLDVLSAFAAPICSIVTEDPSRAVGFLSRQQGLLERLHSEVLVFAEDRPHEIREAALVIDVNIRTFLEYAVSRAEAIQAALLTESYYVNDNRYQELLNLIAEERIKISFALDGWSNHASRWLAVDPSNAGARDQVIAFILREMPSPTMNVEQEVAERVQLSDNTMSLRNRLVKEMHSWMDDSLDEGLYARVSQARALAEPVKDGREKDRLAASGISEIVKSAIAYRSPV